MNELEASVLASLDGDDPALLPFLPELLEDLDDLGADPVLIGQLLERHTSLADEARVLDLGCGKGSVTLHLLQKRPWTGLGLDGMQAFLDRAQARAALLGLASRARFEQADIRTWPGEGRFDAIVLGAIGPVLGDTATTLRHLDPWLAQGGCVVMDEAYLPEGTAPLHRPAHSSRAAMHSAIGSAGFRVLAEEPGEGPGRDDAWRSMFEAIRARADALGRRCPEHARLFEAYVQAQAQAFRFLQEEVVDVTLLLIRDTRQA